MNKTKIKNHPTEFWLVPWSVGYECKTKKPAGESVHAITREKFRSAMYLVEGRGDLPGDDLHLLERELFGE